MNEEDKKTRKYWVGMLWGLYVFNAVTTVFLQLYLFAGVVPLTIRYWTVAASLLSMLAVSYFLYRCAYKKNGTKFLTFCLVSTALGMVFSSVAYFFGKLYPYDQIPYYGAYFFLTLAMSVVWGVLCWKMRKVNKKLRAQTL